MSYFVGGNVNALHDMHNSPLLNIIPLCSGVKVRKPLRRVALWVFVRVLVKIKYMLLLKEKPCNFENVSKIRK